MRGVGGVHAEAGGQHTVEGRRRAAALHVPEHGDPHFLVDPLLDLEPELLRDAGEPLVPELVDAALAQLHRALGGLGAFGHHADEVRIAAHEALL